MKSLSCILLSAKNPTASLVDQHNSAFSLWFNTFESTFRKIIHTTDPFFSDNFLIQDEIIGIFHDNEAIGLACLNKINSKVLAFTKQAYFEPFPKELMNSLFDGEGRTIVSANNLCVHPKWRKMNTGFNLAEIIVGLVHKNFEHSKADKLITISRNDKKVNNMIQGFGGKTVSTAIVHGVPSDIILTERDELTDHRDQSTAKLIDLLWRSRTSDRGLEEPANINNYHYFNFKENENEFSRVN